MKKSTRIISLIIAIIMIISAFPLSVFAENEDAAISSRDFTENEEIKDSEALITEDSSAEREEKAEEELHQAQIPKYLATSGTTGSCTWTLIGAELTISGNGAMGNYSYGSTLPWGKYITKVTINAGVTSIGYATFSGCSKLTSVTIGNSVTSIGSSAFYGCSSLTSIVIPDGVTSIGSYAFYNCSKLTSIVIPDSVTSIGYEAFYGCSSLIFNKYDNAYYLGNNSNLYLVLYKGKSTNINSCIINSNAKFIHSDAFRGCSILTSVTIGNSVTSIGDHAFYGCSKLTSVTIGNSVTSIGAFAFYGCSSLTSVTIGNSVTSIGASAFYGCSNLTSVVIPDSVTSIGDDAFSGCSSLTSVTIGNSVTSIGIQAFQECSSLTGIVIPDSVTSIDWSAFSGCSSLTSVTIGNSVTSIGDNAFIGCSSLTGIVIPDSVTSIGYAAFSGCSSLTSVTIGNSVTSIDSSAFSGCSSLESITVDPNNSKYRSENNCLIEKSSNTLILGCKNSIIPDSVTSIGDYAFGYCSSLTGIVIPDSVTSIGYATFSGCSSLTSVTIGNSVTSILDEYIDSIQSALSQVTSGGFDEEFKNVANSILEYSKYAAEYFGKETSITNDSMEFVGTDKFEAVYNDFSKDKAVMICGLSLVLKDKIVMNFWVDAGDTDLSGAKVYIDGIDLSSVVNLHKNGKYYNFSYSCGEGLMAKVLSAYIGDTNGECISNIFNASVAGYCIDVINNASSMPKLVPLAKKILNYIYYADLYFENQLPYDLEEDEMPPVFDN